MTTEPEKAPTPEANPTAWLTLTNEQVELGRKAIQAMSDDLGIPRDELAIGLLPLNEGDLGKIQAAVLYVGEDNISVAPDQIVHVPGYGRFNVNPQEDEQTAGPLQLNIPISI